MTEADRFLPVRAVPLRPLAGAVAAATLVGVAGGVTVHRLRTAADPGAVALPELHGQAVWASGARPAPAFALRDERGAVVSLRTLQGRPVLVTFLSSRCTSGCPAEALELGSVLRRLPAAERPTLLIVSLDPEADTPAAIHRAVRRWSLAGAWRWHWLTAGRARLASVWRAYGVGAQPATRLRIVLIDRSGNERAAYLFPFLPAFVGIDLARLAGERT